MLSLKTTDKLKISLDFLTLFMPGVYSVITLTHAGSEPGTPKAVF